MKGIAKCRNEKEVLSKRLEINKNVEATSTPGFTIISYKNPMNEWIKPKVLRTIILFRGNFCFVQLENMAGDGYRHF